MSGSYPLLNVSPSQGYSIGQVDPGLGNQTYRYTIAIPKTVQTGVYSVDFNATYFVYGPTGVVVAASVIPVSFHVQNYPDIKVVATSSQPSALYTGYNQTVDLAVENVGYGTARNVSVTVAGGYGTNLLNSVTTFFISNLTAGSSVNEPILVSSQNTGTASLTTNVSYYSQNFNKHFGGTQVVDLVVAPAAQFTTDSSSGNLGIGATDTPVRFKITNTGTSTASQVQFSLLTNYPLTPIASTAYVSSLPAGASTNVTFLVSVDSAGVSGNYPVTIYEQWRQPNGAVNQQFSGSGNYYVTIGNSGSGIGTEDIIIGVVIVVAAVIVYTRMKKPGQKKDKK